MKAKTLPAIKKAEEILRICTEVTDEEIQEALRKIGIANGTWGVLWGFEGGLKGISRSELDMEFFSLKGEVLEFVQKIRKKRIFAAAVVLAAQGKLGAE